MKSKILHDCKKQVVTATIIAFDGSIFTGQNSILNQQSSCPRDKQGFKSGEGYELCKTICGQISHAEVAAIKAAGDKATGGTLYLEGHSYVCDPCHKACVEAGIVKIIIGIPPS